MGLEMRKVCESCSKTLIKEQDAYICTHECTFCPTCSERTNYVCPNCSGELVKRPKPAKK